MSLSLQGDQKEKDIIALNPRGTVPIIVDEGPVVMYDSLAATEWIQGRYSTYSRPLSSS
jgi:glutathione S-transferase